MPATQCSVCRSASTWDFLQDFYRRVDEARQHTLRLEYELHHAIISAERTEFALVEFQRDFAATQTKLDEERLEHTATREELEFERQRHRETEKLFDLTYDAAQESGGLVDGLRAQVAELQGNTTIARPVPTTADLMLELKSAKDNLMWLEEWLSSNHPNCFGQDSNNVQQDRRNSSR
jgi:hypothetical protein